MDQKLASQRCTPCTIGSRPLPPEQINLLMPHIPRWKTVSVNGMEQLQREFHFKNFKDAFTFAYKVAALAEREDHHPRMVIEWGQVTINWWTHKVNGLHSNDFVMAAKTDLLSTHSS